MTSIKLPRSIYNDLQKKFPNKNKLRLLGMVLDKVEKDRLKKLGLKVGGEYDPYDVTDDVTFDDIKLFSQKTVTISNNERALGIKSGNYRLRLYSLDKENVSETEDWSATSFGILPFNLPNGDSLREYLSASKDEPKNGEDQKWFFRLEHVEHFVKKQ